MKLVYIKKNSTLKGDSVLFLLKLAVFDHLRTTYISRYYKNRTAKFIYHTIQSVNNKRNNFYCLLQFNILLDMFILIRYHTRNERHQWSLILKSCKCMFLYWNWKFPPGLGMQILLLGRRYYVANNHCLTRYLMYPVVF